MIYAGLMLLAVGAIDLVRQFVSPARRWIGYLVAAALVIALGAVSAAIIPALVAIVVGVAWVLTMPTRSDARLTFWPAVILAVACTLLVMLLGDRTDVGLVGAIWQVRSPVGLISFDLAVLTAGVVVFLLESCNVVVRAALSGENTWRPADIVSVEPSAGDDLPSAERREAPKRTAFAGGRLIGPLERMLVFVLTLVGAYALLAAMLAAKGIVRFPEISKDGETGARAEYFLVGSFVSWVTALGGALLVWWGAHSQQ